jgi:hypothetical protein
MNTNPHAPRISFLSLTNLIAPGQDGIHSTADSHQTLALKLAQTIKTS